VGGARRWIRFRERSGGSGCQKDARARGRTSTFIQVAIFAGTAFTDAPPRALLASPSTSRLEVAWTCSSIWWAKLPLDGPGSLPAAAPHPRVRVPPQMAWDMGRPSSRQFSVVTKLSRHGLLSYLRPYYTLNSALSVGLYRNKAPSRLGTLRLRESNHAGALDTSSRGQATDGARPSHACTLRYFKGKTLECQYYSVGFFLRASTSASLASLSDNLLAIAAAFRAARSSASAALASSAALAASAAAF
jgi:hypothetical protein